METYFIKKKVQAESISDALAKEKDAPIIELFKDDKDAEKHTGFKTE